MKAVVLSTAHDPAALPFPADHPIVVATGNDTFCGSVAAALTAQLTDMAAQAQAVDGTPNILALVVTTEDTVATGDSLDSVSGLYRKHV